jgi:hypothetical protein
MIGQVLGKVVTLLGSLLRLDGVRTLVEGRIPLIVLAPDKSVEVLEAAPT